MNIILRATQNPPFGWVVAWEDIDAIGRPLEDHETTLRQPDCIKVKFDVPDGNSTTANTTRKATSKITPYC